MNDIDQYSFVSWHQADEEIWYTLYSTTHFSLKQQSVIYMY